MSDGTARRDTSRVSGYLAAGLAIGVIVGASIICSAGIMTYFSPYRSCLRALPLVSPEAAKMNASAIAMACVRATAGTLPGR